MVVYDYMVIGGGVVGAAVARELASCAGQSVLLCEKEDELLTGASSGNTGHLGSNFYYLPDRAPLEAQMTARAREINPGWLAGQPNVPRTKEGMVYLARSSEDDIILNQLLQQAAENRVSTVRRMGVAELTELEPELDTTGCTAALFSDVEYIVDPWLLAMTHVYGCEEAGVDLRTSCQVLEVEQWEEEKKEGGHTQQLGWNLHTTLGRFQGKYVINCAGNFGDSIEKLRNQAWSGFRIRPGKGEYVILEGETRVGRPVVPIPTKKTAGVYVFPSISGHTVVGPTNRPQDSKTDGSVSRESVEMLVDHVNALYPATRGSRVLGVYSGLRPATEHQDYCINFDLDNHWVTVGGIRSTGLTCSLAISQYVASRLITNHRPVPLPPLPKPIVQGDKIVLGTKVYRPTHPLSQLALLGSLPTVPVV